MGLLTLVLPVAVPRLAVELVRRHIQVAIVPIVPSLHESKPYICNGLAFVTPGTHSDMHMSGKTQDSARRFACVGGSGPVESGGIVEARPLRRHTSSA